MLMYFVYRLTNWNHSTGGINFTYALSPRVQKNTFFSMKGIRAKPNKLFYTLNSNKKSLNYEKYLKSQKQL